MPGRPKRTWALALWGLGLAVMTARGHGSQRVDFQGITHWLNTASPPSLASLQGKVVLVNFWTYSCIYCIRTLPQLKAWHQKYRADGLEMIGVHTPEFHFEKDVHNVQDAVLKFKIPYAVAMDNNYRTWDAFGSRNWPSVYLIDRHGVIRYRQSGEANTEQTEKEIQALLAEDNPHFVRSAITPAPTVDFSRIKTREIFLGLDRLSALGNDQSVRPGGITEFRVNSAELRKHKVYLVGRWRMAREYVELASEEGEVLLCFEANKSNLVMSNPAGRVSEAEVFIDGEPAQAGNKGDDVTLSGARAVAAIQASRMYNLSAGEYGEHRLDVHIRGPGARLYTITFG